MTAWFYDVLGVRRDADDEEIRRAYRERMKETHPDVSDAPDADARTRNLVEAKETLLDPVERRRYDRLGHDAYVSNGTDAHEGERDDVGRSAAVRDARDAGWGTDTTQRDGPGSTSTTHGGPTNARASAAERRARERRARERVGTDETGTSSATSSVGDTANDRTGTGTAPGWATSMADRRVDPTVDPTNRGVRRRTIWSSIRESPATTTATFGLYPLLVAGAVFPPFPLYVNAVVAACTLVLIAALQSMPGIGVFVFAAWSVLGAVGLAVAGVHPISLLGMLVLGSTWFPLGFTVLTYWALRA